MSKKTKTIIEFGDFQTPLKLAEQVISFITSKNRDFKTIVEPTCGYGTFIEAILGSNSLCGLNQIIGWDINPDYVTKTKKLFVERILPFKVTIQVQDFFQLNWRRLRSETEAPILFVGNPPWVTNSEIGRISGQNLPEKINLHKHSGLNAMTGKSNFDISEWMMIQIAHFISSTDSVMAFLIKSSVARKVFSYVASAQLQIQEMQIRKIDAKKYFNVNVDACLFYAKGGSTKEADFRTCPIFSSLSEEKPLRIMAQKGKQLIADVANYNQLQDLDTGSQLTWRSGIKHDCAKVMELNRFANHYENGFHERITDIGDDYLYPMYKSSDIAKNDLACCKKFMLVPQKRVGDSTKQIETESPKIWEYLLKYSSLLDARKSNIYKNAPRFSIFGVGDYTFRPWKVAISGLYKTVHFSLIPPFEDKPVVLDDTCYFLSFDTREQAELIYQLMTSDTVSSFIESIVFFDDKRPITASLLNRINLEKVAEKEGLAHVYNTVLRISDETQRLFCFS